MTKDTEGEGSKITPEQQRFYHLLGEVVSHVANEPLLLVRYEQQQEDAFARIWPNGDSGPMSKRLDEIVLHLGGPPRYYILQQDENPPPEDGYPGAALQEVLAVFERARKSVIRAHMFLVGNQAVEDNPELLGHFDNPKVSDGIRALSSAAFWEHAEAAYIRLASYWDRVGQVLNFAFFNIRKFDRDGFQAVVDRIHANVVRMDDKLAKSSSWKMLRDFQTSGKDDGYKWLQERRNLVVHSLHLQPVPPEEDASESIESEADNDTVFTSQFNHLDHAHREKLRPREPRGEVLLLMNQLNMAGVLFKHFLSLLEASPSKKRDGF